jgi:hypothetical protein
VQSDDGVLVGAGVGGQDAPATQALGEQPHQQPRAESFPGGHTAELHITHKGHDLLEAGKRAYASADNDLSLVLGNEQLTVLTRFLLTALAARQPGS